MALKGTLKFVSLWVHLHLLPCDCAKPETLCDKGQKLAMMLTKPSTKWRKQEDQQSPTSSLNKIYSFINSRKFFWFPPISEGDPHSLWEMQPQGAWAGRNMHHVQHPTLDWSLSSNPKRNCQDMVSHIGTRGTVAKTINQWTTTWLANTSLVRNPKMKQQLSHLPAAALPGHRQERDTFGDSEWFPDKFKHNFMQFVSFIVQYKKRLENSYILPEYRC